MDNDSLIPETGKRQVPSRPGDPPPAADYPKSAFSPHRLLLLGIVFWTFGCNLVWVLLDTRPPSWDQGSHLHLAFKYGSVLSSGSDRLWSDLLSVEPFYPPFYHLSLLPVFAAFGFSADNAVLTNSLYLAVIILSTYGIGQRLYGRGTGLLAAFLVSCYPFLAYVSRQCLIGTMLGAAVTLAYYLFLRCKNFEDRRYSFWFSAAFAAGLMVKWTFFFYMIPAIVLGLLGPGAAPHGKRIKQAAFYLGLILATTVLPFLVYILAEGRWAALLAESALIAVLVRAAPRTGISPGKILNLITLTCVSVMVCFPWYAHNLVKMLKGISKFGFPAAVLKGFMEWELPIWGFYLEATARQMGIFLFAVFVIAFFYWMIRREQFNLLLFGWVVFPIIVFTFINNKGVRYTLPCLAAMAIVSAVWILRIKANARGIVLKGVVGLGIITYVYAGFFHGNPKVPWLGGPLFGFQAPPVREHWPIDRILDDIVEEAAASPGNPVTVRTLTNHPWFHRGAFRDAAEIRGLPIIIKSVKRNLGELTDFFITKDSSKTGESGVRNIKPKKSRLFNDPALKQTFSLFRTYPLPNGARGLVFEKRVTPAADIQGADDPRQVEKRFVSALARYPIYGVKDAVNPQVTVIPTQNPEDRLLGRYKMIRFTADSAVSNKVRLENFELTFEDVQINLYELFLNGKLIFFEIGRLFPRGTIFFDPLERLAEKEMKGKGKIRLHGEGNRLRLEVQYEFRGMTLQGKAAVKLLFDPGKRIRPVIETLELGPVAVPEAFYRRIADQEINLHPTPGWPMVTDIRSIKIYPRKLAINPSLD